MNDVIYRESLRTVDSQERSPMLLSAAYFAAQYSWVDNETYPAAFDQAYFHSRSPNHYLDIVSDYAYDYLAKVRVAVALPYLNACIIVPCRWMSQAEARQADVLKGTANYTGILGDSEFIVSRH